MNVERIDPNFLSSFAETKALITSVASEVDDNFTSNSTDGIARQAQEDERKKFCQFIDELTEAESLNVDPLPYRRVLSESESNKIWGQLDTKWGMQAK